MKILKNKNLNRFIFWSLILCLILRLFFLFRGNWRALSLKYDDKKYADIYIQSQYRNPLSNKLMPDYDLYAYAGYQYLKGVNPLLINPEHPPLGKLIIGLVIYLTGFHRFTNIIFTIACCFLIYHLGKLLGIGKIKSLLLLLLFSFDGVFIETLLTPPSLDIIQLFFVLLFFIFIFNFNKTGENKYLFLGILMIVLTSGVKFWINGIFLGLSLIIFLIAKRWLSLKRLFLVIIFGLISSTFYFISYFGALTNKVSFQMILGAQKWMYEFHRQGIGRFADQFRGNFLQFIYLNKWKTWFGGYDFPYKPYHHYYYLWPVLFTIFFIISAFYIIYSFKNKTTNINLLFFLYIWLNIIFLSMNPFYPNYMFIFLPFIYLLCFSGKILFRKDAS